MRGTLSGIKIIESPHAVASTQIRFPRTKKKRILKKWKKQDCNYALRPAAYMFQGEFITHPEVMKRIVKLTL